VPICRQLRSPAIIRAFLFDLDGTLVDTERLWVEATQVAIRQHGYEISHAEALELAHGRGWADIWANIIRAYPDVGDDMAAFEMEMRVVFRQLQAQTDVRIPSSIALLRRLAEGYPVAIVSGSPRSDIAYAVQLAGIEDSVRFVLGSEDYPRGKPDPAPFAIAAERLGLPPSACLVFEDSRAGVESAKAAGMTVVALQRPGAPAQDFSLADAVLTDLADFDLGRYSGDG